MKITAIIPAAGDGVRFGEKKQLKLLNGRPLIFHTIQPFIKSELINEIILVVPKDDVNQISREFKSTITSKKIVVIEGGRTRQQSVNNGLRISDEESELICVHDGVRPFVTLTLIEKVIKASKGHDGAILALPSTDTILEIEEGNVISIPKREHLWHAQTPQGFQLRAIKNAYELLARVTANDDFVPTDDCSVLLRFSPESRLVVVHGSQTNIKITYPFDLTLAETSIHSNML